MYNLFQCIHVHVGLCMQEVKREQMEEQRRAAAAARQEIKEDKKPKQAAAGPAPSMALRTAASLQRALSNDDDGMFWDYGPAAGQRGMLLLCKFPCQLKAPCHLPCLLCLQLGRSSVPHLKSRAPQDHKTSSGMHAIAIITRQNIKVESSAEPDGCKSVQRSIPALAIVHFPVHNSQPA